MTKDEARKLKARAMRILEKKDPGNADGPRLPKPSSHKLRRKRAKAARKRNRGAYRG